MNKIKDLRSFIDVLKEYNEVVFVDNEVDSKYELSAVIATLEKRRTCPPVLKEC
ncbi:hypothetical protein [endosymbiont 'TC1' of Trimyema compressum]|uniref:hypothetical protein n=1 Tax=endosymbiont 'TC1' of Trimyema compressum TaxID=243899 RepID=UPI00155E192A|nr:hypothetical protein [endosymbiont 'TC1' of Trimyema compressum]